MPQAVSDSIDSCIFEMRCRVPSTRFRVPRRKPIPELEPICRHLAVRITASLPLAYGRSEHGVVVSCEPMQSRRAEVAMRSERWFLPSTFPSFGNSPEKFLAREVAAFRTVVLRSSAAFQIHL